MTHEIPNESSTGNDPRSRLAFLGNRRIGLAFIGILLLGTLGFFGMRAGAKSEKPDKAAKGQQATPVTIGKVTQKTVPVQLQAIGNVQAMSTVSVTPQIGGSITGVFFKKGQEVKKGQLLFTLDDRTAQAAIQQAQGTLARDLAQVQQARATYNKDLTVVRQAQANLAKDQAQAKYAQAQSSRYNSLYQQGAVTLDQTQQYAANSQTYAATLQADQQAIANAQAALGVDQATIKNAEGVVASDQGVLQNAQVQLSYTKIYAPIDGRAGDILVNQGNVVQAGSNTALVKIEQIHPMQVSFSVPEANLPQIQKYLQNGKLPVAVTFPNTNGRPINGILSFVNNTVDNATGTIQLMGQFDDRAGQLWPGQYVNTTLTLTTQPNATVVPSQAVQNGPNGQFVFVVKPDMTVANVPVAVSSTIEGLAVVQKGLQPGDQVVLDGQANLIDGGKIRTKSGAPGGENAGENPNRSRKQRSSQSAGGNS
ncbi:MAG: efflux RND transporter periplasmic adaptor subunit [Leptolyngbya sp. BL-A-14]